MQEVQHVKPDKKILPYALAGTLGVLLLGAALVTGCGKKEEEAKGPGPSGQMVADGSSCVSCHTDAERLKTESAGIKKPKGSALTSGKG